MADPTDPVHLAETFAEIARALLAEPSLDATLVKIVRTAVEVVEGCEHGGISLIEKRKISTRAASDPVLELVDAIQYETDEGPCLDAIRDHEVFLVDDLEVDDRWPTFGKRAAAETGIRSMLSFRLFAEEDTMGALNLYAVSPGSFGEAGRAIGSVLAAHAAVAISTSREIQSLHTAIESRSTIEQAKGIIMASAGCTADEAFDLLRQQSQSLNEKLRDVASRIVEQQHGRPDPPVAGPQQQR